MTAASAGLGLLAGAAIGFPIAFFTGSSSVALAAATAAAVGVGLVATNIGAVRRRIARR